MSEGKLVVRYQVECCSCGYLLVVSSDHLLVTISSKCDHKQLCECDTCASTFNSDNHLESHTAIQHEDTYSTWQRRAGVTLAWDDSCHISQVLNRPVLHTSQPTEFSAQCTKSEVPTDPTPK